MIQKTDKKPTRPNAELLEALSSVGMEAAKPGAYETLLLHGSLLALKKGRASDKEPHQTFLDVCQYGLNTLKDYQDNLAESPAAHVLLEYLQTAFQYYICATNANSSKRSTADRRSDIAKAFGITGESGKPITEAQKIEICSAFSSDLYDVTEQGKKEPTRKDFIHATRAAYKTHFGRDWIKDDDAAKKGERAIRNILKNEGYLGKL